MSVVRLLFVLLVIGVIAPNGWAVPTYSGSLSSALSEIDGREAWINPGPTTIAWEVTDMGTFFHYKYTLTVPASETDISHFVIEISGNFTESDFWNETGPFGATEIGDFGDHNGNPNIPSSVHGLKFDETTGTTAVIEFDSLRVPVWGDFYSKGGRNPPNEAWNEGFAIADPLAAAANGTIANHILVPDSVVPEPGTCVLFGLGGLMLFRRYGRPCD